MDPIQMHDLVAMVLSTVLGTAVGWERQMGRKPAGLRTHVLGCLGSTMFVLSIMRQEGYVAGLTTAASIWIAAAIGAAVGVHAYMLALFGTVLTLVVLEWYRWIERWLSPHGENAGDH